MAPRKRSLAKLELDPTQRKITHYFPKSENWKHDFTLTIPMRKAPKRTLLVPEIIATIELDSSDDEFQASRRDTTTEKTVTPKKGVSMHLAKERKPRKKRAKKNNVKIRKEAPQPEASNHETVNCADFVETHLETEIVQHTLFREDTAGKQSVRVLSYQSDSVDVEVDLSSLIEESVDIHADLPNTIVSQAESVDIHKDLPNTIISQAESVDIHKDLPNTIVSQAESVDFHADFPNTIVSQAESVNIQVDLPNTFVSQAESVNFHADFFTTIVSQAESADKVDPPNISQAESVDLPNPIVSQAESMDFHVDLPNTIISQAESVDKVDLFNKFISQAESMDFHVDLPNAIVSQTCEDNKYFCSQATSSKNFALPVLSQVPRSTRVDSVRINKLKNILINCPAKSKSIILQSNTVDLFSLDDENIEATASFQINDTANQCQNETEVNFGNENDITRNLYLESFASSNKENSPEVCNTLVPSDFEEGRTDILPKSEPRNNSIDIIIASLEAEESNAMDTTLIKDYVKLNNSENIHDVLVELHHALDRMENTEAIDPDSPYYKMFFLRKVIRNVVENFDMLRLLRDVERRTLVKFLQMDTKYQYFCFRLFTRLPKWYNMYKLIETIKLDMHPKEISDMYACLQENNFIQTDYSQESIATLLHLLERSALTRIHSKFKINKSKCGTKESIIDSLIACCNSQPTLSSNFRPDQVLYKLISVEMGPCAKLENNFYTTLSRVHLLNSFTNQDLVKVSDLYFLLAQIERGEVILPSYDVESAIGNIFPRRQDFLLYSKAAEYKSQFVLKMEKTGKSRDWISVKDICDASFLELQKIIQNHSLQNNSELMNRYAAGHKYASILSEATKHLTKGYPDDVEKWLYFLLQQPHFCQKRKGLWYDRLAMIKSTYKKEPDQAAEIVLKGLDDGSVTESGRREIINRGVGLMKRKTCRVRDDLLNALKLKLPPNSLEHKYSIRNILGKQQPGNQGRCYFLEYDGGNRTYYTVEEYSIKYYTTDLAFTDGVHCEGALFSTLFTVLFWDVIYDEYTAGAFINNLQVYPLDYFSKDFYTNREDAIDGRLEQIASVWSPECLEKTIRNNFEEHKNKRCGIASNLFQSGEQLVIIAKCIGRERLALVMKRRVLNLGDMCAGLPDLFVWNSHTYKCKFVEVKSEKDVLSMKQILWLNFLVLINLDAEVCYVLPGINTPNVPVSKRATVE